jgi:hypothetical protein
MDHPAANLANSLCGIAVLALSRGNHGQHAPAYGAAVFDLDLAEQLHGIFSMFYHHPIKTAEPAFN